MERIRVRFVEVRPGGQIDDPERVSIRLSFIDTDGQARVWPARRPYEVDLRPDLPVAVDQVVFEREYPGEAECWGRASASLRVSMEKRDPADRPALEVRLMWALLALFGVADGVFFGWLFDSLWWGTLGVAAFGGLGWMVGWSIARRVRHLYPRQIYGLNRLVRTWYESEAGQSHACRFERRLTAAGSTPDRKAAVELVFVQE